MTQNNLGAALQTLGARESDGTAARRGWRRQWRPMRRRCWSGRGTAVPLDWAMTQSNLGNALQTLGRRDSGTARLEAAVEAYEAALLEWTQDKVPLQWAMNAE